VVFVPVAFISGITGLLYQQFAITIAISVLFSAVSALTLSPALSSLLLKPTSGQRTFMTPFYEGFNRIFDRFTGGYMSVVSVLIRKSLRSLVFIGVVVVLTGLLGKHIPTGFVPVEDQGYVLINVQLPEASSLQRTDVVTRKIEGILAANPAIDTYTTITGLSLLTGATSSNMATFFISLKPWDERTTDESHASGVLRSINAAMAKEVPEAMAIAFGPPPIPGLGTGAGFTMMLQDRAGNSPEYLAEQTQRFIQAAQKRPEIGRIFTLFSANVPQIFVDIDRDKALKLGVSLDDLNTTLGSLLGSAYINDFNRFGRVYKVYAQAEPEFRANINALSLFFVRSRTTGKMIPLDTLVTSKPISGPEYTNRFNLFRSAELSGVPALGYSSADALKALEEVAAETLPSEMGYAWADTSFQEKRAEGTAAVVFAFAMLMVFLILAAQYESWSLPFAVLLGTPFAAFGAFFGLWMARYFSPSYENNVFAQIGLIMLIGLAAKNAILIVEFAKMKREEGMEIVAAALEGAKLRLRPILMTAFAFILGVVPLLTASGAGAEARKVMGMAVFCGMSIATFLGICLVPVLYVVIEKLASRSGSGKGEHTS
jgi:HAE1 family hydrophobic/amphiphilic exporter-1